MWQLGVRLDGAEMQQSRVSFLGQLAYRIKKQRVYLAGNESLH